MFLKTIKQTQQNNYSIINAKYLLCHHFFHLKNGLSGGNYIYFKISYVYVAAINIPNTGIITVFWEDFCSRHMPETIILNRI